MKINTFLSILLSLQIAFLGYQYQDQQTTKGEHQPLWIELLKAETAYTGPALKAWLQGQGFDTQQLSQLAKTWNIPEEKLKNAIAEGQMAVDEKLLKEIQINVALSSVKQIDISDFQAQGKEAQSVVLKKSEAGKWVVASAFDYPAEQTKVNGLAQRILSLDVKDILATKAANHPKLNVAQNQYDKKLSFKYGDQSMTWYIGNGKSGRIHLRREGSDVVYQTNQLSTYEDLNSNANQYMNTQYFSVKDPIKAEVLKAEPLVLEKKGETWEVNGFTELGKALDEQKLKAYLNQISELYLDGIASKEPTADQGFDQAITVKFKTASEEKSYQIAKENGNHYFVKASDQSYVVKVSSHKIKNIIDQKRQDFAKDEILPTPPPTANQPNPHTSGHSTFPMIPSQAIEPTQPQAIEPTQPAQ